MDVLRTDGAIGAFAEMGVHCRLRLPARGSVTWRRQHVYMYHRNKGGGDVAAAGIDDISTQSPPPPLAAACLPAMLAGHGMGGGLSPTLCCPRARPATATA